MQERSPQAYELPFGPSDREMSRDAYSLLAQANLLRMRGCWPEAVEKCMAALKLAPEHPSAQSLLGDIYENQGYLDDAIQWYRMALDVQPDSPADKVKLERLLELKAREVWPQLTHSSVPITAIPSQSVFSSFWYRVTGRVRTSPETLLRRTAFAAGAAVLLIVLAAIIITHITAHHVGRPQELNVPAVVVPTVSETPTVAQSDSASSPADPAELSLLATLQGSHGIANMGVTITGVQTDPRAGRLTLTVTCQPAGQESMARSVILHDAMRVVKVAASAADPRVYTQFTVRCLLASAGGGSTPLVFMADASRVAVAAVNTDVNVLTDEQVSGAFSSPWWSPAISP